MNEWEELKKEIDELFSKIHDLKARRFQSTDKEESAQYVSEIGQATSEIYRLRAKLKRFEHDSLRLV